jgi:competence protein ComGF
MNSLFLSRSFVQSNISYVTEIHFIVVLVTLSKAVLQISGSYKLDCWFRVKSDAEVVLQAAVLFCNLSGTGWFLVTWL